MVIKLLFCILIPIIRGDPRLDPMRGLANMMNDWDESQLFIFYEPKPQRSSKFQNPDCFAFQLSFTYAFTTSSCFMNLEEISKMVFNHEINMKSTIEKFVVYKVILWSFFNFFLNVTNKNYKNCKTLALVAATTTTNSEMARTRGIRLSN